MKSTDLPVTLLFQASDRLSNTIHVCVPACRDETVRDKRFFPVREDHATFFHGVL